jgi:hypothetical protein
VTRKKKDENNPFSNVMTATIQKFRLVVAIDLTEAGKELSDQRQIHQKYQRFA